MYLTYTITHPYLPSTHMLLVIGLPSYRKSMFMGIPVYTLEEVKVEVCLN